jgi:hypothetical protein
MSDSVAPDSPLVTYPPNAARPGYNYYPDSPDPIYVSVPGHEGFVDQMTDLEIAERARNFPRRHNLTSVRLPPVPALHLRSQLSIPQIILYASASHFRQLRLQPLNFD